MSEKSDIEIVHDIKNGSVSAFQELYSRYADIVYRNILARVNSSFDADDIFQDFFIQVWEKKDSFQVSSSVKGYLLIWLRNHILNSIKQEQIRDKYQDIYASDEEDDYTWVKIEYSADCGRISTSFAMRVYAPSRTKFIDKRNCREVGRIRTNR